MTKKQIFIGSAIAIVALALVIAGFAIWNAQRAAAAEADSCENGPCSACVEVESCCANAEDISKEAKNV